MEFLALVLLLLVGIVIFWGWIGTYKGDKSRERKKRVSQTRDEAHRTAAPRPSRTDP